MRRDFPHRLQIENGLQKADCVDPRASLTIRLTGGRRVLIALGALAAAIAVYSFARPMPPLILARLHTADHLTSLPVWLTGSAPAFLYTLAICLLMSAAAPGRATRHCIAWTGVAVCLELAQHPGLAMKVEQWLAPNLPGAIWQSTASYWTTGTFDPVDLAATCLAGLLAVFLTRRIATGADS